jgi:hypothetical protein
MLLTVVGFEVLIAVSRKMAVFWIVVPCSPVEVYQCFRGPFCFHHQGDDGGSRVVCININSNLLLFFNLGAHFGVFTYYMLGIIIINGRQRKAHI